MSENRSGCLRNGCFGCVGLVGLGLLVMVAFTAMGFVASQRPSEIESETVRKELPPSTVTLPRYEPRPGELSAEADAELGDQLETITEGAGRSLEFARIEDLEFPTTGVGTLRVDLRMGEFFIVPSDGDQIEVVSEFDTRRFELSQEFKENGEDWEYEVEFGPKGRFSGLFGSNADDNRVEIRVPRGRPIRIVGEMKMGRSESELGGLWLQDWDMDLGMGEHYIDVSEPTPQAARSFRTEGRMGALHIGDLGNASPEDVQVEFRMGEVKVGLEGPWITDSEIYVNCGMGECRIETPDNVHVETEATIAMGERSVRTPDTDLIPEGAPTLQLKVQGSMGEVRVQ